MFVKGYDFRTFGFINTKVLFKMRSPGNETTTLSMCCDVSIHRNGHLVNLSPVETDTVTCLQIVAMLA